MLPVIFKENEARAFSPGPLTSGYFSSPELMPTKLSSEIQSTGRQICKIRTLPYRLF
jgi:hypothetical protein